jgi:hypothetical protein
VVAKFQTERVARRGEVKSESDSSEAQSESEATMIDTLKVANPEKAEKAADSESLASPELAFFQSYSAEEEENQDKIDDLINPADRRNNDYTALPCGTLRFKIISETI